jgi:hypothetical protein
MNWDPSRERFTGSKGDESWVGVQHRDRLPARLPADGEPTRLAQVRAWALDPGNEELAMFARISVELA